MLERKRILITGGTGSFGKAFVKTILTRYPNIDRLVVYSRDELKQFEMSQIFSEKKYKGLRYFIGDVRDRDRLNRALEDIDIVIHAAALKQVPTAEYNPFECIKTNIMGAQNLIETCLDNGVSNLIALSTDKAAAPINLYGATKLCSDKLFTAANNIKGSRDIKFSVVRYGNVLGSRGSVIPFFLKCRESGILPITDDSMTRFNITLQEGVELVLYALDNNLGGEIFVPKIPSYRIMDVAEAIAPDCKTEIVGIRQGEKIHEEMITTSDSFNTIDMGENFAILPSANQKLIDNFISKRGGTLVDPMFTYNSGTNDDFLTVDQIRQLVKSQLNITL